MAETHADRAERPALPVPRPARYENVMGELWEEAFVKRQLMWGFEPTASALRAKDDFVARGVKRVLVPGFGYGRNAKVFLDAGMSVTGIEISQTAIELARSQLEADVTIHHGSVTDMPFDDARYDAVFCFGLLYLLDSPARAKLLRDCANQLAERGEMVFTVVAREPPLFGRGTKLADDWYETEHGVRIYFWDEASLARDFAPYGLVSATRIEEPMPDGSVRPFLHVVCRPS